ncbi:hypothetical protein TNCV_2359431 [Trichonephila clavipes]|nr:hypothetical protein TNCV_2359431 [Trichonephila clavipes]
MFNKTLNFGKRYLQSVICLRRCCAVRHHYVEEVFRGEVILCGSLLWDRLVRFSVVHIFHLDITIMALNLVRVVISRYERRDVLRQRYSTAAHRPFLSGPVVAHCSEEFTYLRTLYLKFGGKSFVKKSNVSNLLFAVGVRTGTN